MNPAGLSPPAGTAAELVGNLRPAPLQNPAENGTITYTQHCAFPDRGTAVQSRKGKINQHGDKEFTMAHTVTSECVACGACVDTCPVGAITMEDKAVVDAASCVDCGACEGVCPTGAIQAE